MNKSFKHIFHNTLGRIQFSSYWESLYKLSLLGLNYGYVGSPETSGEKYVIQYLSKQKPVNGTHFTLVNVGANEGQYFSLFKSVIKNYKAILFEPSGKCCKTLESIIDNQVQLINAAVAEKEGTANLFFDEEGSTQGSLLQLGNKKSQQVQVTTLDQAIEKDLHIDLMVIDTEGYELNVLMGATQLIKEGRVKMIQFEHGGYHSVANRTFVKDFFDILPGYDIYHIKQNGIKKMKYSVYKEIFHLTNYLAIKK